MSKIEIAKMSDLDEIKTSVEDVDGKVEGLNKVATTGSYNDLDDKPAIPVKVEKTSELQNDSGFITAADVPEVTVPDKTSQLENDSGFITSSDIPAPPTVPTKVSELENDTGFITGVTGEQVSATVEGLEATNVQGMIAELKALIDALGAE